MKHTHPVNVAFLIDITGGVTRADILEALRAGAFVTRRARAVVAIDFYGDPPTIPLPGMEIHWFQFSGRVDGLPDALRRLVFGDHAALYKRGGWRVLNEQ